MSGRKVFLARELIGANRKISELESGELGLFEIQNGIEKNSISEGTKSKIFIACDSWHLRSPVLDFRKNGSIVINKIKGDEALDCIRKNERHEPFPDSICKAIDESSDYDVISINILENISEVDIIFLSKDVADRFMEVVRKCMKEVNSPINIDDFN